MDGTFVYIIKTCIAFIVRKFLSFIWKLTAPFCSGSIMIRERNCTSQMLSSHWYKTLSRKQEQQFAKNTERQAPFQLSILNMTSSGFNPVSSILGLGPPPVHGHMNEQTILGRNGQYRNPANSDMSILRLPTLITETSPSTPVRGTTTGFSLLALHDMTRNERTTPQQSIIGKGPEVPEKRVNTNLLLDCLPETPDLSNSSEISFELTSRRPTMPGFPNAETSVEGFPLERPGSSELSILGLHVESGPGIPTDICTQTNNSNTETSNVPKNGVPGTQKSAGAAPMTLDFKYTRLSFSKYCLTWKQVLAPGEMYTLKIMTHKWDTKEWEELMSVECLAVHSGNSMFEFDVEGGNTYKATVHAGTIKQQVSFRAEFSKEDLAQLHSIATNFNRTNSGKAEFKKIDYIYRTKPRKYMLGCLETGIMKKYCKDNNGDSRCPINGALDGLFFATETRSNGEPPPSSHFGDTRLRAPASFVMSPMALGRGTTQDGNAAKKARVKLYFSDFFCMTSKQHWVTIVLTYAGSAADSFCAQKLHPLNIHENDFLYINDKDEVFLTKKNGMLVEVFYTEDIDMRWWLDQGAMMHVVQGRGHSKKEGKPKNSQCKKCHLPGC